MTPIGTAFVASLAATAALAVSVPAAGASATANLVTEVGPCATTTYPEGQGGAAGTNNQICVGAGAVSVGESIGQVATVAGPSITGSAVIGNSIVALGDAAVIGPV